MKIIMKQNGEEKGGSSNSSLTNKIRIAVFGQHDVGKSALTVRFLTRRYIGEYKSNTDLLYRQTLALSHTTSLDIEIVDISTTSDNSNDERKTFPVEELHRADGFIIVYSITDRSSFSTALQALADIHSTMADCPTITPNSTTASSTTQYPPVPIALIANKCDLEHLRSVEKAEGMAASLKYEGCQFYELSVAENSPEVYSSFQSIINSLSSALPQPKRKFSVTKMLGNLRLGRNSSSFPVPTSPASISDTNVVTGQPFSSPNSPAPTRECSRSPALNRFGTKKRPTSAKHERQSSNDSSTSSSSSSSSSSNFSICHLKSKLHSMKIRQHSPPICSL